MSVYSDINQYDTTILGKLNGIESIYQSIDNILLTPKYQRLFLPEFGMNAIDFIFDPKDRLTLFKIKTALIDAVERWEPRIDIDRQLSGVSEGNDVHTVNVNLVFTIKNLTEEKYVYLREVSKNTLGQYYAV